MKTRTPILKAVVVGAMVIALGGAALGADSIENSSGSDNANDGMTAAGHASAHVDVGSAAAGVIASLVGGVNPSTTISQHADNDHATQTTDEDATNTNATETETDNDNNIEAGHGLGQTGTAGTKPGFGCGDTNHTHSGPPGRPGASMPPGCTKH